MYGEIMREKVLIKNLEVNNLNTKEFFIKLEKSQSKNQNEKIEVNFLNAHCFNIAQQNTEYRKILNTSKFLLNDGVGIEIAALLNGNKFKGNMNGTDLIPKILHWAEKSNYKVFLLGSKDTTVYNAKIELQEEFKSLRIVGYNGGYFSDDKKVIEKINGSGADILILGMGVPLQETWVRKNLEILNPKIYINGGAYIDFASKEIKRAPKLLRKLKIEWIFRLLLEPKRLWKRYILGNLNFFYYILKK